MKLISKILCTAAVIATTATNVFAYKQVTVNTTVNGKSRSMVVFTPNTVSDNMPLMIVTHGMNQSPEYQYDADKLYTLVDSENFIIAYLRSDGTTWDIGGDNDMNFVIKSIGEMHTRYNIDPHRVYWSGFSMGSMLIYHSIHKMQGKIAAFAPTSGVQFSEQPWTKCTKPVKLIHCHSFSDDVFPYEQYDVKNYVFNMAKVNEQFGENTGSKDTNYSTNGRTGEKTVWTNTCGAVVERFMYNGGGHWPTETNKYEIWNFVKQFSLTDEELDGVAEGDGNAAYTVDESSELKNAAANLNGKTLFVTNDVCSNMWYVNTGLDSPQNVRVGAYSDIAENPYCWLKFTKVSNAGCATTGNLYTVQLADQSGSNYNLWGSTGNLNTPPGTWCLFALGITDHKYGQDADYYGLWKVEYNADLQQYTMQNVGALQAGENSYVTPSEATPVANFCTIRLFSKLKKVETAIEELAVPNRLEMREYDLNGRFIEKNDSKNKYRGKITLCGDKKILHM